MKYLKDLYLNFLNFIKQIQFNILKQKTMYDNLTKERKTMIIQLMFGILGLANEKTSTKEIKDSIHTLFPGIELRQAEVHEAMNSFYEQESSDIKREMHPSGLYYEYSFSQEVMDSVDNGDALTDSLSTTATNDDTQTVSNPVKDGISAVAKTSDCSAVFGKVTNYPEKFLQNLDQGLKICFSKNKDNYILTNTKDRVEARNLFKKVTGEKHENVRMINISTYLKRKNLTA